MKKSKTQLVKSKSSKDNKSKKIKQKCVNAFNDYYYDHFVGLSQKAASQKQIYSQIIPLRNIAASIKKYPYPILSLEQASSLQGIGEHYIGKFKKLINDYKIEIKENNIDYVSLAYSVKPELGEGNLKKKRERSQKSSDSQNSKKVISFSNPGTKKASQLKEIKAEAKKLKFKNNLININLYSSVWTTCVCCYIVFFDKESYDIDYASIINYGKILKNKFIEYNIKIEEPNIGEDKKDIEELKNLKLIDSVKKTKITINDYLIKLVKIELEKIGFSIKKDNLNGVLEYTKFEIKKNNTQTDNAIDIEDENDEVKNSLLEEYINFMSFQNDNTNDNKNSLDMDNNNEENNSRIQNKFSDNIYLIIDLREKGAGNENFRVEILNKLHSPIPIEEKNLSLGDFTWIYKDQLDGEEYMLDFIIERKTLNDLSASILDGRYNEQKYRLKNSPYKNIYYLFEGTELNTHNNSNLSKDAINTAINNTINIHDIKFYRTFSTKDTVNKLIELDSNIRKSFSFLKDINGKKITYKKYVEIFAKTKNSTVEEIFLRQLRCFEHCGKKCVEVLNNCFQTPLSFYKLIQGLKDKKANEKDMTNIIACCYYLHENNKEINVENVLECFEKKEDIEKFKKEICFTKLLRKLAVLEMLNFYCFYDEDKNFENEPNEKSHDENDISGDEIKENIEENNNRSLSETKVNNPKKKKSTSKTPKKKTKDKKSKKNKNEDSSFDLNEISDDNNNNNIDIDNSELENENSKDEGKKKKKRKNKKNKSNNKSKNNNKSKDKKRKKKDSINNDSSDEINGEEDILNKNENCVEEQNKIENNYNDIEIRNSFKHLEDIGDEEDFNNFEYQ